MMEGTHVDISEQVANDFLAVRAGEADLAAAVARVLEGSGAGLGRGALDGVEG